MYGFPIAIRGPRSGCDTGPDRLAVVPNGMAQTRPVVRAATAKGGMTGDKLSSWRR
ncbi:hypothetical protein THARTR1_00884 [Trichoderma harzianum]|uniref:Uncharacterized protein n=1 Tax=Trichoderma harzianum TaxID=5544 RepID=A0A2K0UNP0_TRIHA|nr:hypothetical protein THARTR1_00884 [Trichoderma harzianum]